MLIMAIWETERERERENWEDKSNIDLGKTDFGGVKWLKLTLDFLDWGC
jgi:hypothetical protein